MFKSKLAIITTHPIQYNAPLFKLIAKQDKIELKVFYTWGEQVLGEKFDPGFGKNIKWDIPLLNDYNYEFLENVAKDPGSHHFNGIENPNIISTLTNFHPDAVLVYGWAFRSHLKIIRYCHQNKILVLFRGDSTLTDEQGWLKKILRNNFLRWVYRHIDIALYVGKNNYDYYKKFGLKNNQLIFAPHAVDNNRMACNNIQCVESASSFRKSINIGISDFLFLFAGKIESKKDPLTLVKAFMECRFAKNVVLVIVGNGELENDLKTLCKRSLNIHFVDFQNQSIMPAIYKASDVFILPSIGPGETWGLAVNEAMAAGKPVIVSNKCGCAADLLKEGINGFTFEAGNYPDLAGKMKAITSNQVEISEMGMNSLKIIGNYSLERIVAVIGKVLNGNYN